ncbi:MAG: PEP-utilizing enzyme, partial [Candidatus Bathyarchaeia archaeon]
MKWKSEEDKKNHWWLDNAHVPHPASPLYADIGKWWKMAGPALDRVWLPSAKDWTGIIVNGYVYSAVVPRPVEEQKKAAAYFNLVMPAYIKLMPEFWEKRYEPELRRNLEFLDGFDYENASLGELMILLEDGLEIFDRHWLIHWVLNLVQFMAFINYESVYEEVIGKVPEDDMARPLATFQDKNMEVLDGIWKLKEGIKKNPKLRETVTSEKAGDILKALEKNADGQVLLRDLNAFLKEYGNKAVYAHEFIYPTWREDPSPVIETIKSYLEVDYDFPAQIEKIKTDRNAAVKDALSKIKNEKDRQRFQDALTAAQRLAPLTPNHHFYIDQWSNAALRKIFLAIGERFRSEGVIDDKHDILYLELLEVKELAGNLQAFDPKPRIADRKRVRQEQFALKPPIDLGTVTEETASDIVKIKLWGWVPPEQRVEKPKQLRGLPAATGIVEGVARIVISPAEFNQVQPGDILVCDMTNPVWVPLFSKVKGVVTNSGGMLAHAAIVAREFGIPAVVGTMNATRVIANGQRIRVDGTSGNVSERVAGTKGSSDCAGTIKGENAWSYEGPNPNPYVQEH